MAVSGMALYGVALLPRENGGPGVPDCTIVRFRDLGALVRPSPYTRAEHAETEIERYRRVVDAAFARGAVLPAPCGTVFRSADQVRRWLAQNYIALSEGIHFVAGRCEARVHIIERPSLVPPQTAPEAAAATTAAAGPIASECFRLLRRTAVAAVPIRHGDARAVLSGAFLIEQDRWAEFVDRVQEQAQRYRELAFEQSGPWAPYDFVRMDFGV